MHGTMTIAIALLLCFANFASGQGGPLFTSGMVRSEKNLLEPLDPPPQSADENPWRMGGESRIHHFHQGTGRNILFLHGGPGYPVEKPLPGLKALSSRFRIHYYHQRGCGDSTRPIDRFETTNYFQNMMSLDRMLGIGTQIADIERIRRILGDEKLVLIGHSFGGFLASLYAAEFPDRVAALILVAPADVLVMPQETEGIFEIIRSRLPANMQEEFGRFMKEYFDFSGLFQKEEAQLAAVNREFGKFYLAALGTSDLFPPSDPKQTGGWLPYALYFSMGMQHDYRDALAKVDCPVLVLHGEKDLQPAPASQLYADSFSNSRFEVLEGCSHFPFYERPSEFGAKVLAFLDAELAAADSFKPRAR